MTDLRGPSFTLLLVTVLAALGTPAHADAERDTSEAEVVALRHRLSEQPGDVDTRFALALRLSWMGELAAARSEASAVIAAAPRYWDAHLLLGRVDAWSGHFDAARARVLAILDQDPGHVEARRLAVDIELWQERPKQAQARARDLVAVDDSAESRYASARAAALAMRPIEVRSWARRTMALKPKHAGARELLAAAYYVRLTSATEFELFPKGDNRFAIGELLLATLFPTAKWSVVAGYDYRLRFGTENHRGQLGGAYRLNSKMSIDGMVRGGSTVVVPELSAGLGFNLRRWQHYAFSVRYLGDKMPWPGQLHRIVLSAGAGLPAGFEVGARYEGGILRYCSVSDPVQSLTLRGDWSRGKFGAGLRYGFGMELDRAPLPPFLAERFGDDVCRSEGQDGVDLSLRDTRAQIAGGYVGYQHKQRFSLRLGYVANYRLTGDLIHAGALTLNVWL